MPSNARPSSVGGNGIQSSNKNNIKSLPLGDEEERPVGNFVNPWAGRDDAQTEQSSLTNNSGALKCPPPPCVGLRVATFFENTAPERFQKYTLTHATPLLRNGPGLTFWDPVEGGLDFICRA